ncbi:PREDICTED: butyrophilin-like protein 1, partial [Condylura cristata]|uniref:butyrophilin-like protein 1 n=1 Tax=Condylura cristata TaxID=143302 RepID=UPI000642DCE0
MAPRCCPSCVLCLLPCLLLLFQTPRGSTDPFWVIAPPDPIVAELGEDATLSCSLYPAMSAEDMEVRWFRSHIWESVFTYQDRQERSKEQMAQYSGRTSLVGGSLSEGKAAVRIHKVQAADNGLYTCSFRDGDVYEEASMELRVAGVGSAPQVHITGPEQDGVRVVCMASGWFPEPQVQWRDPRWEQLLGFSQVQAQDPEGLFIVEAALVVRDSAVGSVTCSMLNPILGQEKAMTIVLPEPFFPRVSPWQPALLVILPLLLLLLLGAAYCTWREHSRMMPELGELWELQQLRKWGILQKFIENDRQSIEDALKDT